MQLEGNIKIVETSDQALVKKSLTGRFPYLEKGDGVVISDILPIARVLSSSHVCFGGVTQSEQQ